MAIEIATGATNPFANFAAMKLRATPLLPLTHPLTNHLRSLPRGRPAWLRLAAVESGCSAAETGLIRAGSADELVAGLKKFAAAFPQEQSLPVRERYTTT